VAFLPAIRLVQARAAAGAAAMRAAAASCLKFMWKGGLSVG